VNAELPASTVFGRIDLHSCRPCLAACRVFDPSAGVRPPGNDYSGAVERCLSADQSMRGMNRASPDWGNSGHH
jgi:hypothetical protein